MGYMIFISILKHDLIPGDITDGDVAAAYRELESPTPTTPRLIVPCSTYFGIENTNV